MAKTKLTKERYDAIVKLIGAGNYTIRACQAVGIGRTTYDDWLRRGEADEGQGVESIYRSFRGDIKKAESDSIAKNVALIGEAAKKEWQAAAWLLERKYPKEWGRRIELGVDESNVVRLLTEIKNASLAEAESPKLLEAENGGYNKELDVSIE